MQGIDFRPLECIGGPLHGFLHIGGPFTVQGATDAHMDDAPPDAPWTPAPHSVTYSMYAGEYMSCVSSKESHTYLFQLHTWGGRRHPPGQWERLNRLNSICKRHLRTPLYFGYVGNMWELPNCRVALMMPAVTLFVSATDEHGDEAPNPAAEEEEEWAESVFGQWMGVLSSVGGLGLRTQTGELVWPVSDGALMHYRGYGSLQIQRLGPR